MIKAIIIEDEQPAALRLEKALKGIDPEIEILAIIDTVDLAIKWFEKNPPPDLILLDIQLGDGLSFEIFNRSRIDSYIIFTTAFDKYAIRAFELNSIDYLLKPISEARLAKSIEKFKKFQAPGNNVNIQKLLDTLKIQNEKFKKRFVVAISGKIKVIETGDIAFFYSNEKNTFLCSLERKNYPLDFSLDHIQEMLDPELFFRVNRQYIVQYKSISGIDILSKSRIRITTNPPSEHEILVSTARTSEFRNWLDR